MAVHVSRETDGAMGDELLATLLEHKAAGNAAYQQKDYDCAVAAYSKGVKLLPYLDDEDDDEGATVASLSEDVKKQGAVVLCNRAAAFMGMGKKKAVAALADAQRAADFDPSNWKERASPPPMPAMLAHARHHLPPARRRIGGRVSRS